MNGSYAMAIKVNGYYCDNNAQVALANRDINPAFPSWTPGQILPTPPTKPANPPAVVLASSLTDAVTATPTPQTTNPPEAPTAPGGLVNLAV